MLPFTKLDNSNNRMKTDRENPVLWLLRWVGPRQVVVMKEETFKNSAILRLKTYISLFEKIFLQLLQNSLNKINQVYLNCHQSG